MWEFPLALTTVPERTRPFLVPTKARGRAATTRLIHVDTFGHARELVLGSDAIAAAVESQIEADVKLGKLTILSLHVPWLLTRYGFIHLAGRPVAPSVAMFMNVVREVEHQIPRMKARRSRR